MKKVVLFMVLITLFATGISIAQTTQWYDEFNRPSMGSDWTWAPNCPASDVAINNGVVEITIPSSSVITSRGWITTFSKKQGSFHARIRGEAIRDGADFYFNAKDTTTGDSIGWCFNGMDVNSNRIHFFSSNAAAASAGDGPAGMAGIDDDWYDVPTDPRYGTWSVTDWHWYSLVWSGDQLIPYVDGVRINTDVYSKKRIINRWVPNPDASLKIEIVGLSDGGWTPSTATKMYVDDVLFGSNQNKWSGGDSFNTHIWDLIWNGKIQASTAILLGLLSEKQIVDAGVDDYMSSAEKTILNNHGSYLIY